MVRIAVIGCSHGQLDRIYSDILNAEEEKGDGSAATDLVIMCGDFEAIRNASDLPSMAVSTKYAKLGDFWQYYTGIKKAPYLTLVIGGNHECSNYMTELPYGGWLAENIFFMGRSGVVNFGGLRIVGLSGIYKVRDFMLGYHEAPPFNNDTVRSVYHVRNIDMFRLAQLRHNVSQNPIDIFISHDWPKGFGLYGLPQDVEELRKLKPDLVADMDNNQLGNPASKLLISDIYPRYCLAAHLHVKFKAVIKHPNEKLTKFLALSKPFNDLPHLQFIDCDASRTDAQGLAYDREWLGILKLTDPLISVDPTANYMPNMQTGKHSFSPDEEVLAKIDQSFEENYSVPRFAESFEWTAPPILHQSLPTNAHQTPKKPYVPYVNSQTVRLQRLLCLRDPVELICANKGIQRITQQTARAACQQLFAAEAQAPDQQNSVAQEPLLENQTPPTDEGICPPLNGHASERRDSMEDGEIDD